MKTAILASIFSIFVLQPPATIYDFKILALGETTKQVNLADFKGKKIMIVNTGCKSPYAYQIEQLQKIYRAYGEKLVIICFPAGNDFGDQELKTNAEIRDYFIYTWGVTFPVSEKTTTIGSDRHPVFSYLLEEAAKLGFEQPVIKWNFTKFLLDEEGKLLTVFPADVTPMSTEVTSYLNNSWKF